MQTQETLRTFAGYVCVGIAGVALYMGLLWCFDRAGLIPFAAFTLSYIIAVSAQFLMNKYLNFRAFDRAIHHQASTYIVVTAVNYVLMIAVEELGIHLLHVDTLMAYALSIPVNLPIGYLANRFLTFGPGITESLRRYRFGRGQ